MDFSSYGSVIKEFWYLGFIP